MPLFTRTTRLPVRSLACFVLVAALAACAGPAEDDATTSDPSGTSSRPASSPTSAPDSEDGSARPSKSPTEASAGPTLEITVEGGGVGPNAEEISLAIGEPLTISFSTDRAGELHVHSKPEQYVEFGAGRSTQELVIKTPGTVEIEEHETGAVVAVVEVS